MDNSWTCRRTWHERHDVQGNGHVDGQLADSPTDQSCGTVHRHLVVIGNGQIYGQTSRGGQLRTHAMDVSNDGL